MSISELTKLTLESLELLEALDALNGRIELNRNMVQMWGKDFPALDAKWKQAIHFQEKATNRIMQRYQEQINYIKEYSNGWVW